MNKNTATPPSTKKIEYLTLSHFTRHECIRVKDMLMDADKHISVTMQDEGSLARKLIIEVPVTMTDSQIFNLGALAGSLFTRKMLKPQPMEDILDDFG